MDKDVEQPKQQMITSEESSAAPAAEKKRASRKKDKANAQVNSVVVVTPNETEPEVILLAPEELEVAYAVEALVSPELDFNQVLLDFLQTRIDQFHRAGQALTVGVTSANLNQLYLALEDLSFGLKVLARHRVEVSGGAKLGRQLGKLRKELVRLGRRENFLENMARFTETRAQPASQPLTQLQARLERQRDKASKRLVKTLNKLASRRALVSLEAVTLYALSD
jgi:hypothetical protein